ncbi:molybdopterin cofactor-binding domain-containing protein [Ramlibacter sp.]|uniref:xanthine dehydrogenase family protein molybdopterin-binding subunit n=1 Tax=Ramlibacter sp. TaxID=1917967 RepID=UPI002607033B|nr:molybdopterin cofactor-binding domain-containing protein [Ramlibacter sp.]MDB5954646.1 isoquinoline 1-oxidoreductase [Ramlibacter sp.]
MQRRQLLLSGAAALTQALVVGFSYAPGAAAAKSMKKEALDAWLALEGDGRITIYSGKVDLGTGVRTALTQMVADELDVPMEKIVLVMGDTATTIDQGQTAGSLSISAGGQQLRQACATARQALATRAAATWGVQPAELAFDGDGMVRLKADPAHSASYASLLAEGVQTIAVDPKAPLKKPADHRFVGKPVRRLDIPAKVTGEFTYVHDLKLPGMVHARVIRPAAVQASLLEVDDTEAKKLPGYLGTVHKGNFLAVLARTEWEAVQAAQRIQPQWSVWKGLPAQDRMMETWRAQPVVKAEPRPSHGDVDAGLAQAAKTLKASYEFGIHSHASLGPSCAVARADDAGLEIWSPSQATHSLQTEVALMLGVPKEKVRLHYLDGSGCYGRNGHEDCTADAALAATLLAQRTGQAATVRVQWMRDDEHGWDPKSPPTVVDLEAGLDAQGGVTAWKSRFIVAMQNGTLEEFPLLAAVHSGVAKKGTYTGNIAHNSDVEYAFPATLTRVDRVGNAFLRTAHLRTPGRMQNNFANESFLDEVAAAAGKDPVQMRLAYLKDERSRAVVEAAAKMAGWQARPAFSAPTAGPLARGRGFAYIRYQNEITYVALACDVVVDRESGKVRVERVFCAHDCGQVINPDGVRNQVEGGIVQTVSRTLLEEVRFDASRVTSTDWASYRILTFPDVPKIEVQVINRPEAPPWGAGEMAAAVVPAAIGNAIYDATGVRLRSVPFLPTKMLAALAEPRKA